MPAPYKRRKTHREDAGGASAHGGRKHGRQQLRTVSRTSRRDQEVPDEEPKESSSEEEEVGEEESKPTSSEHDKLQSYNALLTLLAADHKEPTGKKPIGKKREEEETQAGDEDHNDEDDEEEEGEIAGVNFEQEDDEINEEAGSDVEEDGQVTDPFEAHFNKVSESYIEEEEKLIKEKSKWTIEKRNKFEELLYTSIYQSPPGKALGDVKKSFSNLKDYNLKQRILNAYERVNHNTDLSKIDRELANNMFNYQDINFPYKNYQNKSYQQLYVTHALNHVFKTRDRILKNNEKLHNYQQSLKEGKITSGQEPEYKDQGFTRPKVLILLPTRNVCYDIVNLFIKLLGSEQQENKRKFQNQFYSNELPPETKPDDFRETFKGNNNDFFSIGLKFTRKSIKLYSTFYASDIILASPIGLSMILENPDKRKREYDFLSSIEILIMDKCNSIEMQNWDHVSTVLKYINKIPKDFHDADFSRIRMWSINEQSKYLRQNLIFSEYLTPNINNLMTTKCFNLAGKCKYKPIVNSSNCIMNSIGLQVKQIYQRFDGGSSPISNPESRFKFFINSILPNLTKSMSYDDGLLIYIASYYDYLRIKNYMKTSTKFTFESIDEYSSRSKLSRTRAHFQQGKIKILLYTERLHHFRRFEIGGVKNILVYELPSNPIFYKELVRFIGKSVFKNEADLDLSFIKILFSKWDAVSLERIVGSERAPILCNSVNEMFEFR